MTTDSDFTEEELKILQWAVQVASDAVTIQSSTGELPNDDAIRLIDALMVVEDKLDELLL